MNTSLVSVIVCTYNRSTTLMTALDSVAALTLPNSVQWEVLVVDNNSNDQTRDVVARFCNRYPGRFRYLFEPQQGKSHALNAGIRKARGDILAFTDDDVTMDPMWLHNLTRTLQHGEWSGAGGRILPVWSGTLPRWLPLTERYALAPLAMFDLPQEAGELTEPPFGANMAFRKEMFEKYGGFRTDLGPRPGSEIRSEDTEFGARLLAGGERLHYEPEAVVYHPVAETRLQQKYFLAWWFAKGGADIRELGIPPDAVCWWGTPLYLFRRLVVWTLRWIVVIEPSRRFSCKLKVWGIVGGIKESYRIARCKRKWHAKNF